MLFEEIANSIGAPLPSPALTEHHGSQNLSPSLVYRKRHLSSRPLGFDRSQFIGKRVPSVKRRAFWLLDGWNQTCERVADTHLAGYLSRRIKGHWPLPGDGQLWGFWAIVSSGPWDLKDTPAPFSYEYPEDRSRIEINRQKGLSGYSMPRHIDRTDYKQMRIIWQTR